ncbi:MAG: Thioesterase-like superfamily protein [Marmoricola sp.]|nr:Thioesterase-like superfamily protein [Marmoricola sp.]
MPLSYFTPDAHDDAVLHPTKVALSLWSGDQLHGVAVGSVLARALEARVREEGRHDLRAARFTVDLFSAARTRPTRTTAEVVRQSRRLCLVDAVLEQQGEDGTWTVVARASANFLATGDPAPGAVWEPQEAPEPPPPDLAPPGEAPRVPLFASEPRGWAPSFSDHQNAGRKTTWQVALAVVPGERPSGFVAAAGIADIASMVTNWGEGGIEQINTDVTLTLAREPDGLQIGLRARDRVSADGIAVGDVVVFDRTGRLGAAVVTSIANTRRTVDLGGSQDDVRARRGA